MLRPTVTKVEPHTNYILKLWFDNGEVKLFDVKPYIQGEWFNQLANIDYFNTVKVNGYSVKWKDGQDICPDELYENSIGLS